MIDKKLKIYHKFSPQNYHLSLRNYYIGKWKYNRYNILLCIEAKNIYFWYNEGRYFNTYQKLEEKLNGR